MNAQHPAPSFTLRALGDLALHSGGRRVGEARRKPLAVLAYLAVETDRAVNREALAALLWPDASPERARRTLAQTLYALRRECGADLAVGTSQLYANDAVLASDVSAFVKAAAAGDHAAALANYGGPFLDGVAFAGAVEFERWAERIRRRLATMHRDMLLASVNERLTARDAQGAIRQLRDARDLYPADAAISERLAALLPTADSTWASGATPTPRRPAPPQFPIAPIAPIAADGRTHRLFRRTFGRQGAVVAASLCTVLVAGSAAMFWRSPAPPRPDTLYELRKQSQRARREARLASIDTTHLGRVVLLPPRNVTGNPALDSVLPSIARWMYNAQEQTLIAAVPESVTVRLDHAQRATALPTTTSLQIASILRTTQSALAIQPLLSRAKGDSLRVSYVYYRDLSHTRVAKQGRSNLESMSGPSTSAIAVSGNRAAIAAATKLFRWLTSLESCHPDDRVGYEKAPWCFIEGKRLGVVVGIDERQRRVAQRRVAQRRVAQRE